MNITKLPSGNWRARVYTGKVNGRSTYEQFIAPTKKEAEMQAIEFQLELKKNPDLLRQRKLTDEEKEVEKVNATEVKGFGDMTVGEAIDAYINNVEGVLSPSTIRRYRSDRKKFFPGLMDVRLKDLTQPAVQVAVSKDSKKYAAKSIHCAHGLLSAALDVYWPDFQLKTNLPQKVEPDLIIPDSDDVKALLKAIEGTWLEAAVLLGACAGMRRSEICGLKFSDIDLKKSEIHIRRTMLKDKNGKWVVFEKTKTVKSKREVTLPGFIIERLWNMPRDSEFVVNHVPDTISKMFIRVRNQLGLKCRFHDLRHYNASIMLALNVPDKYAMERMGYSTPATLKKVYQHTVDGKRAEVNGAINTQMDKLFSGGGVKSNQVQP